MVTVIMLIFEVVELTKPSSNIRKILLLILLLLIFTVHATKPLELQGDSHGLHKPIKTEARHELSGDISSHKMKTSVIRIPQEYG